MNALGVVLQTAFSGAAIFVASLLIDKWRHKNERRAILLAVRDEVLHNIDAFRADWSPLVGFPPFRSRSVDLALFNRARLFPKDAALNESAAQALKLLENLRSATAIFRDIRLGRIPEEALAGFDVSDLDFQIRLSRVLGLYQLEQLLHRTEEILGLSRTPITDDAWAQDAASIGDFETHAKNPFLTDFHISLMKDVIAHLRAEGRVVIAANKPLA